MRWLPAAAAAEYRQFSSAVDETVGAWEVEAPSRAAIEHRTPAMSTGARSGIVVRETCSV